MNIFKCLFGRIGKMPFEFCELCRTCKRGIDGYISSRKAFLVVLVVMAFILFVGPNLFRWLRERAPTMLDSSIECIETHLEKFTHNGKFDVSVSSLNDDSGTNFLPYVGNGRIGLSIPDNQLFLFNTRSLSLAHSFQPIVQINIPGVRSREGYAVHFADGIGYKFQCFNMKHGCLSITHQFFAYRVTPSLLVQHIEIVNLSYEVRSISLDRYLFDSQIQGVPKKKSTDGSNLKYHLLSGVITMPDSSDIVAYAIATSTAPSVVAIEPRSTHTITIKTIVHYSNVVATSDQESLVKDYENLCQQDYLKAVGTSIFDLRENHIDVWKRIWHSGFGISQSRAHGALNGIKINATLYYVLSNTREYLSEASSSIQYQQSLQKQLYAPDKCYGGHHTLQASTLWSDLKTISDVNNVVSLWLLTLSKQGCHNLIQAGALGVMQSMILSFGGFKFSNHHLEFDCNPKDLHRDYYFRRIIYGNSTHINISVILQEDNKAVIYAALDRSDKDYYGCDAGCLDTPMKLGSEPVQFPVKLTSPLTAILYITADKQHMEELKHTIHVAEVIEAPAHEHQIIALHRHGHQLGGLPTFFWVTVAFLIAVFHLFLIKLILNEYCGNQDKSRKRYLV